MECSSGGVQRGWCGVPRRAEGGRWTVSGGAVAESECRGVREGGRWEGELSSEVGGAPADDWAECVRDARSLGGGCSGVVVVS